MNLEQNPHNIESGHVRSDITQLPSFVRSNITPK